MQELQPSLPSNGGFSPAVIDVAARWLQDDSDYALGCECADPRLQIERWDEAAAGDAC